MNERAGPPRRGLQAAAAAASSRSRVRGEVASVAAMTVTTTRRGLLRGALGTTILGGCGRELATERGHAAPQPTPASALVQVRVQVNGQPRSLEVHPDAPALRAVREDLGLTGAKLGCGHGVCGACTVLLEGEPVASCLLPATSLEGRALTTVEGLAAGGALHPVQRAFMAEDALQCGFCTPGFVVAAAAFHDRWRAEHGAREPDREVVAAALAGHLCRCGAYANIVRAVQAACRGAHDRGPEVGPRHDARDKVTGAAKYTVDVRHPDQLEGGIVRAPVAHGKISRVDWSRALELPGVAGAVDLLAGARTIRYAGQEIAAIAAVDAATLAEALRRVVVEVEPLAALTSMEAAREPGAPAVYATREDRRHPINASEGPLMPERWRGNLRGPFRLFSHRAGEARRAVERLREDPGAGVLVESATRTQTQAHTCLEPHACVARWEGESLTVHVSTQGVASMAEDIAERFDLKASQVRVLAPHVGGGFGSKATLSLEAVAAIELAKLTGRPVRVALDRREELVVGGSRPGHATELALATDRDGALLGVVARSSADAGAAVGNSSSMLLRLLYPDAPKDLEDWDVITTAPPGKPFRGPGGPPAVFTLEQAVDEAAHRLGRDPVALRRQWDPNPARKLLYDWVEDLPVWKNRNQGTPERGRHRRGVGLAVATWPYFVSPAARVQIDAGPDAIVVSTACQDIGNGTRSVLAGVVAGVLGVPPATIEVRIGDSALVWGPMSGGSRTTASIAPAARDAALQLREELVERAARSGVRGTADRGGVRHPGGLLPWSQILARGPKASFVGARKRDRGGWFFPPLIGGMAVGKYLPGALHVIEVEVDTRLGRVRPLRSFAGVAVGEIVAPALARSQVLGGVTQALSYALYEERRLDPRSGHVLTDTLEDYRVIGVGDAGEISVHFADGGFANVNGGGVGLAELVTLAPAPALASAIFRATGFRPTELPIRPDRVLAGVKP